MFFSCTATIHRSGRRTGAFATCAANALCRIANALRPSPFWEVRPHKTGSDSSRRPPDQIHRFPRFCSGAGAYEDRDDQLLDLRRRVVDRVSDDLRRYHVAAIDPSASTDNDFVRNVLQLLPNDGGVWRVSVSAEFEPNVGGDWAEDHALQLRLYRNGVYESLIANHDVTAFQADPLNHTDPISLIGEAMIEAEAGDVLQVRVFTQRPVGETYDVRLTGFRESNWVSFERMED